MNDGVMPHSPSDAATLTLNQARSRFHARHGMPADGGYAAARWSMRFGPLVISLPNFKWRQHAVPYHDMHHIVTGYPCSPAGEIQIAAWEFAAGRYPHPLATAFCLPLVGAGALFLPYRTFRAFLLGRHSKTLYCRAIDNRLLDLPLGELRGELLPAAAPAPRLADRTAFLVLSLLALALLLLPAALAYAICSAAAF